jgi:hypothetical protein
MDSLNAMVNAYIFGGLIGLFIATVLNNRRIRELEERVSILGKEVTRRMLQ